MSDSTVRQTFYAAIWRPGRAVDKSYLDEGSGFSK